MAGSFAFDVVVLCFFASEVAADSLVVAELPLKSTSLSADLPFADEDAFSDFPLCEFDLSATSFEATLVVPDFSDEFNADELLSSKSCCVEDATALVEFCSVVAVLCEQATKSIAAKTTAATQIIYFFIKLR